jgi:putative transposase
LNLWQRLLFVITAATDDERILQNQYFKVENRILRNKLPKRISVTPQERRLLLRFGKPLGSAIQQLVSIVAPRTFLRWLHEAKPTAPKARDGPGRPPTEEAICELVLKFARETGWGYTRILGELKKLGIANIARSTVANILRANGFDTGPKRGEATWADFVARHAGTLWACDFFSKKVWTLGGLTEVFVLFFIHVGSRRVHIAGLTAKPGPGCVTEKALDVCREFVGLDEQPPFLLRDMDGKFPKEFDAVFKQAGVEVIPVGPRAPNLNAFAERFVLSIKSECLDHFVVFGEQHLRHLIDEYVIHYLEVRPHQGLENSLITEPSEAPDTASPVICQERLGGLLKHFYRRAA